MAVGTLSPRPGALGLDPRASADRGEPLPSTELTQPLPAEPLPPPYHLQEVEVPVVGNQVCNLHYRKLANATKPIKDDMLCAGSEGQDSCQVGPQTHPLICPQPPNMPANPTAWGSGKCLLSGVFPQGDSGGP